MERILTQEELQNLFDRISTGYSLVEHDAGYYIVKDPRPKHRILGYRKYLETYAKLRKEGVPTQEDINLLLESRKIWFPKNETEITKLINEKGELEKQFPELRFRSELKFNLKNKIENIDLKLSLLNRRKSYLYSLTTEYLANLEKHKYYIFLLTYKNNKRVWKNWEDFMEVSDSFINHLMMHSYFNSSITEKVIRYMVRHEPWRSSWITSTKTGSLFARPSSDLTDLQRIAVTWSIIYDNAAESTEAPSSDIINDDNLFDEWMKEQQMKRKEGQKKAPNTPEAQEVGIVVDSIEDAKKVYELNSPSVKRNLEKRHRAVEESGGVLKEGYMPDTKLNLQMRRNQLETQKIAGR